jgi:putative chitinase
MCITLRKIRLRDKIRLLFTTENPDVPKQLDAAELGPSARPPRRLEPDAFLALYQTKRRELASRQAENLDAFIRLLSADESLAEAGQRAFLIAATEEETAPWALLEERGNDEHFQRYEANKALGNTEPGDGYRYRGRGYFMLTGRSNYRRMGQALGLNLEQEPDLLLEPSVAYRALYAWMIEGAGRDRKPVDFLAEGNTDYRRAAETAGMPPEQAHRIAGAAMEIEPLVRQCQVEAPHGDGPNHGAEANDAEAS